MLSADVRMAAAATSWSNNIIQDLSQEFLAILDEAGVTPRFKEFCSKNNVLTATDFGGRLCPRGYGEGRVA